MNDLEKIKLATTEVESRTWGESALQQKGP